MVPAAKLALWLQLIPDRVQASLPSLWLSSSREMHTRNTRAPWRLPECLERPQYKHATIGGANYRILDIPASARALNSAAWNQQAFESLACGARRVPASAPAPERKQRERVGGESDPSDENSFSSGSDDFSYSDTNSELELGGEVKKMTEEAIRNEENALDPAFLSSCSAQKEGEEWRAGTCIPVALFRQLIGKRQASAPLFKLLASINARAGKVEMPKKRSEEIVVPLWAPTEKRVCLAVRKIQQLVAEKRTSVPVTHFISLPLATPDIQSRFEVYKHLVLASGYKTIDETLFIDKRKLHITLLVLRLFSPAEVSAAAAALKAASADIYDAVGTRTLQLHLKGNNCFSDDPSAVSVIFAPLYARPLLTGPTGRLYKEQLRMYVVGGVTCCCSEGPQALASTKAMLNNIVGLLYKRLEAAGVLTREDLQSQYALGPQGEIDCVFHMTLLNETYRKRAARKLLKQQNQQRRWMNKTTFDATQLIQDMKGFDFGVARVPSVQLNSVASTSDGGYECLAHIDLP